MRVCACVCVCVCLSLSGSQLRTHCSPSPAHAHTDLWEDVPNSGQLPQDHPHALSGTAASEPRGGCAKQWTAPPGSPSPPLPTTPDPPICPLHLPHSSHLL